MVIKLSWTRVVKQNIRKVKWDALRNFVLFVQVKKREKHPWNSVTFCKVAGLKVTLLHGCFSLFKNRTNDTKLRNASQ